MKKIRSLISVVLAVIITSQFGILSFASETAKEEEGISVNQEYEAKEKFDGVLRCGEDGEFRILTFTDIHIDEEEKKLDLETVAFMKDAITVSNPHLVVFTGDMTNPLGTDTLEHLKRSIKVGLEAVKEAQIPFALVFGNHDLENIPDEMRENDVPDKAALEELYAKEGGELFLNTWAENSENPLITKYEDESGGVTNFNYPIYSADGSRIVNNLYFFDEGSTQEISQYAGVMPDQSLWYKQTSEMLKNSNNGEIIPSLVFQHTIVPEIYNAFGKGVFPLFDDYMTKTVGEQTYVFVPDYSKIQGDVMEWPCPPDFETDQFEAWVEQGDVMAAAFGHDHTNNFTYTESGITLVGMPSTSLLRGTVKSRGATMFTINENKDKLETYRQDYISYKQVKDELGDKANVSRTYGTSSELRLIIYAFHKLWKTCFLTPAQWIAGLFG